MDTSIGEVSRTVRKKFLKVKDFVTQCLEKGITSPAEMATLYNEKYGLKEGERKKHLKPKSPDAFRKAYRRMGVTPKKRLEIAHEALKDKEIKDILEYEEVQAYLGFSTLHQIGKRQKRRTTRNLRKLWEMMNKTNPRTWTLDPNAPNDVNLINALKHHIGQDDRGQWNQQNRILQLLGAYNRTFVGQLPKNWSVGLKRPAGELKDFYEPDEYAEFESNLKDTQKISREGQASMYSSQVNMGSREGTLLYTGILSLRWEDINYTTRRTKIHEKGKRGKPAILWVNVPLDLFPWLHGWEKLERWHEQCFGYKPTSSRHATGRVYPIPYDHYLDIFHDTRHRCTSRIREDTETLKPHILRKTHAQWAKRIGVTLENICGDTTTSPQEGRYGVGWSDPKVPLQYYLTKEPWEYEEQDAIITKRLQALNGQPMTVTIP